MVVPTDDLSTFTSELGVKRINNIEKYLWLAGRPMPPRPLHYQVAAKRDVVVSERMDMHLLWERNCIYLKPIPRYLLDFRFWSEVLCCESHQDCECSKAAREDVGPGTVRPKGCLRLQYYKNAFGFLLSYVALVQYESDFQIAKDAHLLPVEIEWKEWRLFVRQLLDKKNRKHISGRFRFGELRLSRLNLIYRLRFAAVRGYTFRLRDYKEFFNYNLGIIISLTAYVALALSAMQLGIATERLNGNNAFQQASYGLAVLSILGPLILFGFVILGFVVLLVFNLRATLRFLKKRFALYDRMQVESA